jgi:ankyrin repeat protein
MLAAREGHAASVKALLEAGADSGLRNKKRERADGLASAAGHGDIAVLLEKHKNGIRWRFD